MKRALLLLADGYRCEGAGIGPDGIARGEAVFFTGMTGYEEALTDPSYAGQLLVFCYPLIGNYGVDPSVRQHKTICCAGAVFKRVSRHPSHHASVGTIPEWLQRSGVRAIEGVDTRALVTRLREEGTMRAVLAVGDEAIARAPAELADFVPAPLGTTDLVAGVCVTEPTAYDTLAATADAARTRIAVLDCGLKENIARCLAAEGADVIELPYSTTFDDLRALAPDGLVISNGPGDPSELSGVVRVLRDVIAFGELPTFGVCLGHQVLALASGAATYKLKYGHRGGNQPVQMCATGHVLITAQNHGYAVDADSLPDGVEQTMINLNDGTNEGLRHRALPISSVQFHPEASPGPADARYMFGEFVRAVRSAAGRA